jgi:hypothetical protein
VRKTETISSKIKNEPWLVILPTLIQYRTGIPNQSSKKEERKKRDLNMEGRSQIVPLCR